MANSDLTHIGLQHSLAAYLQRLYSIRPPVIITEVALAGSWGSAGRVDVVAVWSSHQYRRQIVHAYEVKVSRSDFLGDIRSGKYKKYLEQADRLFFVFPAEIAALDEVPPECGIILYHHGEVPRFETVRRAKPQIRKPDKGLPWRLLFRINKELRAVQDQLRGTSHPTVVK